MGHHSYISVGRRTFLYSRDGYNSELAALFQEDEKVYLQAIAEDDVDRYGYYALAWQLRQRLHVQGFTDARALADLKNGIEQWRVDEAERQQRERFASSEHKSLPDADELIAALRDVIANQPVFEDFELEWEDHSRAGKVVEVIDGLRFHVDARSLLRLLLEPAPDETEVGLDLHELMGCCVEMDADQPVAESARVTQLAAVSTNAPLIVLTEGRTDSRLLQMAMAVTHPHLIGFVKFIDFDGVSGAEGNVGALAKTVYSFIAAGVANRFVAIADNDTEGHAGLAKLKRESLPDNCRVTHYPDLALLSSYPTVGPYSDEPVLADVNGHAGSLEMYLGHDILTIDGSLVPVQWRSYNPALKRYHGTLMDPDKKAVQDAFKRKVEDAQRNGITPESDWTGIQAIIEHIVHVFA
ncbi:hypothetical protein GCM10010169_63410 [Micromonospora fulviviridis]|nr:hypothetical protein GCM10010169_63410 [Micromonospora fulviviridis]